MSRLLFLLLILSFSVPTLAIRQPPVGAPDLRNAYTSLSAVPSIPDAYKFNFNDPQVLLRSITVEPTSTPEEGSCRVQVRINNLLAKVLKWEPPVGISGIREPPVASPALTWQALLDRVGVREPPGAIVFTPQDGLTITLESTAAKDKGATCSANVLVLGSLYANEQVELVTPISPSDLRSQLVSLEATPGTPGESLLGFNDPYVLVESFDVIPTLRPEAGNCAVETRINEYLTSVQTIEPPDAVAVRQPPGGIEGVDLAGVREPPGGIVFSPNDTLKVALHSRLTAKDADKDKDKNGACAADILLLGIVDSNGN